ncbi:MAG: hypothetical protein ACI9HI_001071 [Salinirussus sp.]|jgi:hypothetical protein
MINPLATDGAVGTDRQGRQKVARITPDRLSESLWANRPAANTATAIGILPPPDRSHVHSLRERPS